MHPIKLQLKEEQKDRACVIRRGKELRKPSNYKEATQEEKDFYGSIDNVPYKLWRLRYEYRHWHIALSLLRGRKIEEIEQPREGNEHDETYVAKIIQQIKERFAEYESEHLQEANGGAA